MENGDKMRWILQIDGDLQCRLKKLAIELSLDLKKKKKKVGIGNQTVERQQPGGQQYHR